MYAIKTPNGFLRSIENDGTIEECKDIRGAEWMKSQGLAQSTSSFVVSMLPHHKRFSVYSFDFEPRMILK